MDSGIIDKLCRPAPINILFIPTSYFQIYQNYSKRSPWNVRYVYRLSGCCHRYGKKGNCANWRVCIG